MNWNRIKCAVLGHTMVYVRKPGYMEFGIGAPCKCTHCGYEWAGLKHPLPLPRPDQLPTPPAPPPRSDALPAGCLSWTGAGGWSGDAERVLPGSS